MLKITHKIILTNLLNDEIQNAQDLNLFLCKEQQQKYLNDLSLIKKELKIK